GKGRISLPVSERSLEMPDRRGLEFRFSAAVEKRKIVGRENFFGIVFTQIGHGVGISQCQAKFLVLSFRWPQFLHEPMRLAGIFLQFRGYLRRRDPVHLLSFEEPRPPLANVQDAASRHRLTRGEISNSVETGAMSALDVGFREPFEIEVAPEKAGNLGHRFRGGGDCAVYFVRGRSRKRAPSICSKSELGRSGS